MRAWLIALGLALSMGPAFADETVKPETSGSAASAAAIPEAKSFSSDHTFKLRGQTIKYTTIAGETYLRDEKDQPTASIFSVAWWRGRVVSFLLPPRNTAIGRVPERSIV